MPKLEDKIKMDLQEVCEDEFTQLALDRIQWRDAVNIRAPLH